MISRRKVSIRGQRGRWVAEVEGRMLGVLHHLYRDGPTGYFGPFDRGDPRGSKRFEELETALATFDLAVLQRDRDLETLARDGYIGVFRFKDRKIDYESGFSLTFVERYADPKD